MDDFTKGLLFYGGGGALWAIYFTFGFQFMPKLWFVGGIKHTQEISKS
jgi:hypothetical protein